jgi:Arc/MetJ family transcription regulator
MPPREYGSPVLMVQSSHMKTTVEIAPALLARAKRVAAQRQTTLRALIEAGLRHVLAEEGERRTRYTLPDARVNGQGVQPGVREGDWEQLRSLIYEGRGA